MHSLPWAALLLQSQLLVQGEVANENAEHAPPGAWIDALVEAKAAEVGAVPAPVADDAEYLRRVTLDLAGRLPAADDVRAFLADANPDKRARVAGELLASEEGTTHLARFVLELTTGNRATYVWFANLFEYFDWLKTSLRADASYDRLVRRILTARGQTDENGATNFVLLNRARPDMLAGAVGRVFLGSTLACAQCHDHPGGQYKREQFWGVAAFFARTHSYFVTNGDHGITDSRFGRLAIPPRSRPEFLPNLDDPDLEAVVVEARWLDGTAAKSADHLREELADFVVRDPAFARNLVNRVWTGLFGRGLVEPLDDVAGEASHPALLDALARFFVAHGHDLRALLREIVASRTYQRSCGPAAAGDERWFVRALARPLDADQLYESLRAVIDGAGEPVAGDANVPSSPVPTPPTTAMLTSVGRIMQMLAPDPAHVGACTDPAKLERMQHYTLDARIPDYVGGPAGTLRSALMLQNRMDATCNCVARRAVALHGEAIGAEHVDWIWLALLSRLPRDEERAWCLERIRQSASPRLGLVDVAWSVVNCHEFSHNH